MSMTRRTFIRTTVAAGGMATTFWFETPAGASQGAECSLPTAATATRFIPSETKILTRRSVVDLAEDSRAGELKAFREAVDLVRKMPDSDVTSWTKQTAQHCMKSGLTAGVGVSLNWQFLPWHRALLYFHERILRTQSKNDDLRLVYWEWERLGNRTVPKIYAEPDQPLFWANRGDTGPGWPMPLDAVDVQPLLSIPSFDIFGGTPRDGNPMPAVLSGGRANVHNACDPGDMSDLPYASRDPLFFAHYCNVDRLWSSWVANGHANPDFGDAKVYFYDEHGEWCYLLQNDLRNEIRLGYRYASLMPADYPSKSLQPFPAHRGAAGFTFTDAEAASLKERTSTPKYLILQNIRRLETLPAASVKYGIFAGPAVAGKAAMSQNNYMGSAARVRNKERPQIAPITAAMNVSAVFGVLLEKKLASLRVAALDKTGKAIGVGIPLAADNLTIVG